MNKRRHTRKKLILKNEKKSGHLNVQPVGKTITSSLGSITTPGTSIDKYRLEVTKLPKLGNGLFGFAYAPDKLNFPVLVSFTTYYVEIFDESMRCIHIHDCDELGYVAEGAIEVLIWTDDNQYTKTLVPEGNLWFIPKGALHSLNNVGKEHAKLWVGFNSTMPSNTDLGIVLNGLPTYLKQKYAGSPHSLLKDYVGPNYNYYFNNYPKNEINMKMSTNSIFSFDFSTIIPEFNDKNLGIIRTVNCKYWPLLKGANLSVSRITMKPNTSTDYHWFSNADANYVIFKGEADIYMSIPNYNNDNDNNKLSVKAYEYAFVPAATPHSIRNTSKSNNLEIVVFLSSEDAKQVHLGNSLLFFGDSIIQQSFVTRMGEEYPGTQGRVIENVKNIGRIIKL